MYKIIFKEDSIEIKKNVNPIPGFKPLYDTVGEFKSLMEIPKDIIMSFSEDEFCAIAWFFHDITEEIIMDDMFVNSNEYEEARNND